jgi:hypothetical protein
MGEALNLVELADHIGPILNYHLLAKFLPSDLVNLGYVCRGLWSWVDEYRSACPMPRPQLCAEFATRADGAIHGPCVFYHPGTGGKWITCEFINGFVHGVRLVYNERGGLINRAHFYNGLLHGPYENFGAVSDHPTWEKYNGATIYQNFKLGRRDGPMSLFWLKSELQIVRQIRSFKNGRLHGRSARYYLVADFPVTVEEVGCRPYESKDNETYFSNGVLTRDSRSILNQVSNLYGARGDLNEVGSRGDREAQSSRAALHTMIDEIFQEARVKIDLGELYTDDPWEFSAACLVPRCRRGDGAHGGGL